MTAMFPKNLAFRLFPVTALVALAACQPAPVSSLPTATPLPTRSGQLTPFSTLARTPSPNPGELATPTLPPTPTPTPITHTVQKGEDMFGIAWQYGVTLEELKAANPTVQPNFLSIGTQLLIPPSTTPMPEAAPTLPAGTASITPVPVELGPVTCSATQEGGTWCFQTARNQQSTPLESISARFRMVDRESGEVVAEKTSTLLLDVLPPGQSLPLAAYYPPPLPAAYLVTSEPLVALPSPDNGRYLPARAANQRVLVAENGLSARVEFDAVLDAPSGDANRVWAAGVAYDQQGNVVGVRRWENSSDQPLRNGQALPVTMQIYSASNPIDRVEVVVEARP